MISVLYVDDEPDLLELGKLFLENNGTFSVTTAESGPIALEILKDRSFDAIVSDFLMPEMNGITFLREIRKTSNIPFILFTGKGREEVVIDAINSGVDFYLQKGGDPTSQFAELGHKIVQAVSRRNAEMALHKRIDLIRHASVTSTRFIQLPADEIDAAISQLLAEIGLQIEADHCYVAQEAAKPKEIALTHEWVAQGVHPLREKHGTFNARDFSTTATRLKAVEMVSVPRVAAMPEETEDAVRQKTWLLERGIKSFLVLPLTNGPAVIGSLGIDSMREEVAWQDEDIDILIIYGQIIAGALARKAADKAIHDSEELYRTVFEATGTAMMILDEDRTVAVANREMERISGYFRSEIEGKIPWTQFVSPDDVERMKHYHLLRRANPSAVPKNYEFNFLARDGKQISTYITVEMIPGTKKSIVSLIDISKEKTAQQELADSEEKFRGLAESLPEGIYMIQDNRFVYVNPAFARFFGYSVEEVLALFDFTDIFVPDDRAMIRRVVAERLAGLRTSERYTRRGIRRDGTVFTVVIHGSKTRYRGNPAIIGTVTRLDNACPAPSDQQP